MAKKKKSSGGGANWMDTYGDMVTLLLCFFVMLYSMSSVDQEKWNALVQSFNPDAPEVSPNGLIGSQSNQGMTQADVDQSMEELYESLSDFISESGLTEQVSLTKGHGYVFISFDDAVFFRPDEFILTAEGEAVLDGVAQSLSGSESYINEIRVLGHTAQGHPDYPNDPTKDRFLSSNRASVVTIYLQEKNFIDPARLVSVSYGQWRPVSSNATPSERAKNRRVELIISGLEVESETGDSITQYYTIRDEGGELPSEMQGP